LPYCYFPARNDEISQLYRENFYFVDRFHGSALHNDRCIAGCEAHTNFSDESVCLAADNVRNEGKFLPLRTYVSLQVKPFFIRKECQLGVDLTFDNRL
jgi:hypothetical protein